MKPMIDTPMLPPLEAAARAIYATVCERTGDDFSWTSIEDDPIREAYRVEARAALGAAVNALDVAALSWTAGHEAFRAALHRALVSE